MAIFIRALESNPSLSSIQVLMERRDFQIDYQDPVNRTTPLLAAIANDREDIAMELIRYEASVELTDRLGRSPLMVSSSRNLRSTSQALVLAGADVNKLDNEGGSALMYASFRGHSRMVQEMLLWGADPSLLDGFGLTPRNLAELEGHDEVINLLDAWGPIQGVWALLSASQVRRLGTRSALKLLPKDLVRMMGSMLVCLSRMDVVVCVFLL
jgi:ankyrin repeat protein